MDKCVKQSKGACPFVPFFAEQLL